MTNSPASRQNQLAVSVEAVAKLDKESIEQMWQIFEQYYLDVDRSRFEADLSAKHDVFLLRDIKSGALQGFSTVKVFEEAINGKKFIAIYSGDTIIKRDFWGQTALQKAFFLYITKVYLAHPFTPVYWFLISKGYKTYLLLSRNFPAYWPCHSSDTPAFEARVINLLAANMFGSAWKADQGILSFDTPMGKLKGEVAPITDTMLTHPDIRFFVEKNPGHIAGDELCCLGKVDLMLAFHFPKKLLKKRTSIATLTSVLPWPARS